MKGTAETGTEISPDDAGPAIEPSTAQPSPTQRTIVIVLAQVVVLVALIVIWRVLTRSDDA